MDQTEKKRRMSTRWLCIYYHLHLACVYTLAIHTHVCGTLSLNHSCVCVPLLLLPFKCTGGVTLYTYIDIGYSAVCHAEVWPSWRIVYSHVHMRVSPCPLYCLIQHHALYACSPRVGGALSTYVARYRARLREQQDEKHVSLYTLTYEEVV